MRSFLVRCLALLFLLPAAAFAQDHGHLVVTVQTRPDAPAPAGKAIGAKVIVVHWTHSQLHPQMVQDQVATTDQSGKCTIDLTAGTYDVFISASGLAPVAVKREVEAGENTPLIVSLKPAEMHLRPVSR
jgi:hypothetical protein